MSDTGRGSERSGAQSARREAGPLTERGQARRRKLLEAARLVFESRGYHETTVADIVREAGASQGTFYTYFDSKEAIFEEVARVVLGGVLASPHTDAFDGEPRMRIRAALKRFADAYRPAARVVALVEEIGAARPEVHRLRLAMRAEFVQRSVRGIRRWQTDGIADPQLDPELVAEALGSMVDQICHVWWNDGKTFEEDALLDTLTLIWARSLGVGHSATLAPTHAKRLASTFRDLDRETLMPRSRGSG